MSFIYNETGAFLWMNYSRKSCRQTILVSSKNMKIKIVLTTNIRSDLWNKKIQVISYITR